MEVVLRKYGNSTVVVLPPAVLKDLGLAAGHHLTLSTNDHGELVLARKRKYRLAELIAECDLKSPDPADLTLWGSSAPTGREVW